VVWVQLGFVQTLVTLVMPVTGFGTIWFAGTGSWTTLTA